MGKKKAIKSTGTYAPAYNDSTEFFMRLDMEAQRNVTYYST